MQRVKRFAISFLVLCFVIGLLMPVEFYQGSQAASANSSAPDKKEKNYHTYKGDAVRLRADQLRKKNKGLDRALKEMAKIGKLPDWEHSSVVQEDNSQAANVGNSLFRPVAYSPAQDTITDGGNELVLITAAGDDRYWDGTVYAYDASTGRSDVYCGTIVDLVTGDDSSSDVVDEWYFPPDGGYPQHESDYYGDFGLDFQLASIKPHQSLPVAKVSLTAAATKPVGFLGKLKSWFKCIKKCSGVAQICKFSPPRYRTACQIIAYAGITAACYYNSNICG